MLNRSATAALAATALLLGACSPSDPGDGATGQETSNNAPVTIEAPAGTYRVDHNHATLAFSISHLGLSNYIARFTDYTAVVQLEPDNIGDSSVSVTIDPTSIVTDYADDYKAGHPDSSYQSWEEELAQSDKFFNASTYPEITFESTQVRRTGGGSFHIDGDLTLLGQTHPVTLNAEIVGSTATHPMSNGGAIGFSASGKFKRSTFGMDYLLSPPLLGDEVTLRFEGEFLRSDADSGKQSD